MTETRPQNRRLGYARVSTYGQTLDVQLDPLRAGAGIRSAAKPFLDTKSDFAEIVFAILCVAREAGTPPHQGAHHTGRADAKANGVKLRAQAGPHPAPAARSDQAARRGRRNAALSSSHLQCQPADDFAPRRRA
jgi:hypothetical protein